VLAANFTYYAEPARALPHELPRWREGKSEKGKRKK
jgi:hypothetical protein